MSKLLKKGEKLEEANSAHIAQIAASIPTSYYTQAEVDALIPTVPTIIPPHHSSGDNGFAAWNMGWSVLHSDNNARCWFGFVAPSTESYKFRLYYKSSGSRIASGKIYVGVTALGEVYSLTNTISGANFDLIDMGVAFEMGYTESAAFNASEGEFIHCRFNKDANDGADTIYVITAVLVIQ